MKYWFRFIFILLCPVFCVISAEAGTFRACCDMNISLTEDPEAQLERITLAILEKHQGEKERIHAIYQWISENITYDIEQFQNPLPYQGEDEIVRRTLLTRKAICQGYSALFQELSNRCGITAFVVSGYVKLFDLIQDTPHAWNAALIEGKWQLFDPTWGAGHVMDNKFIASYNETHFNISPQELLLTRMPFDPVWQLIEYPMSHFEFINGLKPETPSVRQNFNDSIRLYLASDSISRFISESRRVKAAGLEHRLIRDYYNYLVTSLNIILQNQEIDQKNAIISRMNQGIDHFNLSVKKYNQYIAAKNSQFRNPVLSDALVQQKINDADMELLQAEILIASVQPGDPAIDNMLSELRKNLKEIRKAVDGDKLFVEKYLNTPKTQRMLLFRSPVKKTKPRN
jgi:hypothetical protein